MISSVVLVVNREFRPRITELSVCFRPIKACHQIETNSGAYSIVVVRAMKAGGQALKLGVRLIQGFLATASHRAEVGVRLIH